MTGKCCDFRFDYMCLESTTHTHTRTDYWLMKEEVHAAQEQSVRVGVCVCVRSNDDAELKATFKLCIKQFMHGNMMIHWNNSPENVIKTKKQRNQWLSIFKAALIISVEEEIASAEGFKQLLDASRMFILFFSGKNRKREETALKSFCWSTWQWDKSNFAIRMSIFEAKLTICEFYSCLVHTHTQQIETEMLQIRYMHTGVNLEIVQNQLDFSRRKMRAAQCIHSAYTHCFWSFYSIALSVGADCSKSCAKCFHYNRWNKRALISVCFFSRCFFALLLLFFCI